LTTFFKEKGWVRYRRQEIFSIQEDGGIRL
jgi:hypothetical protein